MARKKKMRGGDPEAARNPVAEDDGADAPIEPGALASSEASESDDGPLPEDVDPEDEEDPERGEDAEAVEAAKPPKVSKAEPPKAPVDPRAALRERLGEPAPFPGAIIDPQTGRVENAPPGWDPKRRPPQRP